MDFDGLPEDIIFDIFSRIPLTPLFRLRSVSKLWCKLIDHPSFPNIHLNKQHHQHPIPISLIIDHLGKHHTHTHTTVGLHLVQGNLFSSRSRSRVPTTTLSPTQLPAVNFDFNNNSCSNHYSFGSCNGLVYFAHHDRKQNGGPIISLSNPLRKQCHKLPPTNIPPAAVKTYGLGFDTSTNTFKMVCVFFTKNIPLALGTTVLTLGHTRSSSSWRQISQVPPCPISGTPVFSHGFLHWKVDPCFVDYDNIDSMIVSFDVTNEAFKFFPHHPQLHYSKNDSSLFQLLDLNNNLAIAEQASTGELRIWVMKDYDQKLWVKECCIPIKFREKVQVICLGKDGEVLIRANWATFFTYSSKTGLQYTRVKSFERYPTIYSITGSLFSVNNIVTA